MNDSTKKQAAVSVTVEGARMGITYADGTQRILTMGELSQAIIDTATMHGLKQKIVDAAAMSRDTETGLPASADDKRDACNAVIDRLLAGEWNATTRGTGGNTGGQLMRALMVAFPAKTREALVTFRADQIAAHAAKHEVSEKAATAAIDKALRALPPVAAALAAMVSTNVDANGLMGDLESL